MVLTLAKSDAAIVLVALALYTKADTAAEENRRRDLFDHFTAAAAADTFTVSFDTPLESLLRFEHYARTPEVASAPSDENKAVALVGNISDGYKAVGPFDSCDDAAIAEENTSHSWEHSSWIVTMYPTFAAAEAARIEASTSGLFPEAVAK